MANTFLTPRQVADRLGYAKVDPILSLIHRGLLRAVNTSAGSRATWRISETDLEQSLASRTSKPPITVERRKRRAPMAGITRYSEAM